MKIKCLLVMPGKEVQKLKIPASLKFIKAFIGENLLKIKVNENTIIYKKFTGKSKQFMIKDVTSAETTILKGLKITGTGIKVKTFLLTNNEKLKDYIISLIPNNTISNLSMADELKKYKALIADLKKEELCLNF